MKKTTILYSSVIVVSIATVAPFIHNDMQWQTYIDARRSACANFPRGAMSQSDCWDEFDQLTCHEMKRGRWDRVNGSGPFYCDRFKGLGKSSWAN